MSIHASPQDTRFSGDKGFASAPTALLSRLVLEYGEIIADSSQPTTLVEYARVVLAELRAELSHRALDEGRAA